MDRLRIGPVRSIVLRLVAFVDWRGLYHTTWPTLRLSGVFHWLSRSLTSCWKSLMVSFALSIWSSASLCIPALLSRQGAQAPACGERAADPELLLRRVPSSFPSICFQEKVPNDAAGSYCWDDTTCSQTRWDGKKHADRSRQTPYRRAQGI